MDEQAVHAAEAIVGRAWAEQLLRYYNRMDYAFSAARERCEVACGRLVAAQRNGDPSEISLAHAAFERSLDACRAGEAAREQGRRALEAALDALARTSGERSVSATAGEGPAPITGPATTSDPSIQQVAPDSAATQAAWRALGRVGRLRARRASGPGQA